MDHQSFLNDKEYQELTKPERVDIGTYRAWGPGWRDCEFVIELDARPLAVLAESAALGSRVYEFLSIRRPGDVLHYLWVRLSTVDDEVIAHVIERKKANDSYYRHFPDCLPPVTEIGFAELDRYFVRDGDDTYPFAGEWRNHRDGRYWWQKADYLLETVVKLQTRLRQTTDFLLQNELRPIEQGRHRYDYEVTVKRRSDVTLEIPLQSELPGDLFQTIANLIKLDTVQSVSCPFTDFALWRLLVTEQVQRAQRLGIAPQKAFTLCGPDSGLRHVSAVDWGGSVHIPYEGVCEGDLFIRPEWRVFRPERAQHGGSLAGALRMAQCQYVLTSKDYGELQTAKRTVIGEWVLYESNLPYVPSNPLRLRESYI
jgi:hypothetical protein